MAETFNIYFAGETLEGEDASAVRKRVALMFNASPDTLDKLFSGKRQLIKRECTREEAGKYKAAMEKAGARVLITRGSSASAPASELELAPAGSDVLRPEERVQTAAVDVDVSALSLAEAGATLGTPPAAQPAAPDTSHLSAADPGEPIPNLPVRPPPPPPDTSALSMREDNDDTPDAGDASAPPAVPAPATDSFTLAESGADVLEEKYRKSEDHQAPNTDHLSFEEP